MNMDTTDLLLSCGYTEGFIDGFSVGRFGKPKHSDKFFNSLKGIARLIGDRK